MHWFPPIVHNLLKPSAESSPLLTFVLRLFPESITLNIMTLSGLTVAIGRVVDDSIVVLENIFRQIQAGDDKRAAIVTGTRDVSVAIFAATVVTVVVFLPLGLTGGIIGAFFLPFGLAVTYALASSFVVAITVIPVLVYLLVDPQDVAHETGGRLSTFYQRVLHWALASNRNRAIVIIVAVMSMFSGCGLFATRPQTFIPALGEPEVSINVSLPAETKLLETNDKVVQLETAIREVVPAEELGNIRTTIGGGGLSFQTLLGGAGTISENQAVVAFNLKSQANLEERTRQIREMAEGIFGKDHVQVSGQSAAGGGFGGFSLVLSGDQADLEAIDAQVIDALNGVDGLANIASNLALIGAAGGAGDEAPATYLRVNHQPAESYSGEFETEDTLGVTQKALLAIQNLPDKPESVTVSQGFVSELQTQGFLSLFYAMAIAILIVVLILMVTFGSLVHWLDIILSVIVAPVGAAVALTLTNRALGISALIGMLVLIGIVVTNAVVLIDRVQANRRERGMSTFDALVEGGGRRLRPILMTAIATIMALIPLAIGLSKGAIIASELGTVVIGGLFSSTLLTLIVVPVAYSLLAPVHKWVVGLFGRGT
jgi:HAE1 family hydrophobic/amphiphilic exporter-1